VNDPWAIFLVEVLAIIRGYLTLGLQKVDKRLKAYHALRLRMSVWGDRAKTG